MLLDFHHLPNIVLGDGPPIRPQAIVRRETLCDLIDRVNAGVAWLDSTFPDWANSIDLASLDLSCMSACVAGQVFGTFSALQQHIDAELPEFAAAHGFDLRQDGDLRSTIEYALLEGLWDSAIHHRRPDITQAFLDNRHAKAISS